MTQKIKKCSPWKVFGKNHPQILQLLSRRGPRSLEARLSQHYITFQGLYFLFSGSLSWSMYIWAICPWNKFDEKRSVNQRGTLCPPQYYLTPIPQIFRPSDIPALRLIDQLSTYQRLEKFQIHLAQSCGKLRPLQWPFFNKFYSKPYNKDATKFRPLEWFGKHSHFLWHAYWGKIHFHYYTGNLQEKLNNCKSMNTNLEYVG